MYTVSVAGEASPTGQGPHLTIYFLQSKKVCPLPHEANTQLLLDSGTFAFLRRIWLQCFLVFIAGKTSGTAIDKEGKSMNIQDWRFFWGCKMGKRKGNT